MSEEVSGQSLAKVSTFSGTLLSVSEEGRLLDIIKTLANGKNLKVENHADALALCIKAKELNIPMGTALDHCFIVNGKIGIDVHIAKAKLLSSGCITWERIHDYKPTLNYTDGKGIFTEESLPSNHIKIDKIAGNDATIAKLISEGKFPVALLLGKDARPLITNYKTTYKFTRIMPMIDGTFKNQIEVSSFSVLDATTAGLISASNKESSSWVKYPKLMIDHRAFMNGARGIGNDLLLGMYSTPELLDMNNINYQMTEDGTVTILND